MRIFFLSLSILLSLNASAQEMPLAPEGFVIQTLDPLDGKIARPKDWHYRSSPAPKGWLWTLSKEDNQGAYETGLRIQFFIGDELNSLPKREAMAQGILEKLSRQPGTIINQCPKQHIGAVLRQCLEMTMQQKSGEINKTYRLMYSVMWAENQSWVTLSTFGTPHELWEENKPILKAMTRFSLFGPDSAKQLKALANPDAPKEKP